MDSLPARLGVICYNSATDHYKVGSKTVDFDNWEELDQEYDPERAYLAELAYELDDFRNQYGMVLTPKELELYNHLVDLLHSDKVNAQEVLNRRLKTLKKKDPVYKAYRRYHKKWLELIS